MEEQLKPLEQAVYDFIRDNGGFYEGRHVVDAMRHRIESTIIAMVNRSILEVKFDWTLRVSE